VKTNLIVSFEAKNIKNKVQLQKIFNVFEQNKKLFVVLNEKFKVQSCLMQYKFTDFASLVKISILFIDNLLIVAPTKVYYILSLTTF